MPRAHCPTCGAEVPVEEGVCFFGHEVGREDVEAAHAADAEVEELAGGDPSGAADREEIAGGHLPDIEVVTPGEDLDAVTREQEVPDEASAQAPATASAPDGPAAAEQEIAADDEAELGGVTWEQDITALEGPADDPDATREMRTREERPSDADAADRSDLDEDEGGDEEERPTIDPDAFVARPKSERRGLLRRLFR